MKKFFIFALMAMFFVTGVYALQDGGPEIGDANTLITWLAPIIVWVVGLVAKPLMKIPGFVMLTIVVPLLSAAMAWFATQQGGDLPWLTQFALGFGAVFIDQLKKKLQGTVSTVD